MVLKQEASNDEDCFVVHLLEPYLNSNLQERGKVKQDICKVSCKFLFARIMSRI